MYAITPSQNAFRSKIYFLFILFFCFAIGGNTQGRWGRLLWKFKTAGQIVSTPVIYNNSIFFGSDDSTFYSVSLNGKVNWKYKTSAGIRASASVGDNKVFFGNEDGDIYALNAMNGLAEWKFTTSREEQYDMWDYNRSSPQYYDGRVFAGSGDSNIYCIDASNGKEIWRFKTGGIVHANPVIDKDSLFVGSFDGHFYALSAADGKLLWKFKTIGDRFFPKGEIQKAALVTNDEIYFGSRDYNIYALDKKTGSGLWNRKEAGSWIIATPVKSNENIYYGTSDSYKFYSVKSFSGEVQWETAIPMRSYGTPVTHDTLVFAGCFNGFLYGFAKNSGKIRWKFQTEGSKKNYGSVYATNGSFRKDFSLYGDETVSKQGEQKILKLGAVISSPVIKEGIIYFGSTDGHLYAVAIN